MNLTPTTYLLALLVALAACGEQQPRGYQSTSSTAALGDRQYGGVFRLNESEFIKSLHPHGINDVYSYRVAAQVYEGLFKFNQETLAVTEGLAESCEVAAGNVVYTIKLRKGVKFHDDPCFADGKGRELTAQDVQYAFTQLCTAYPENRAFHIFDGVIKGARAYFNASANGAKPGVALEGVKVLDTHTLQLTLEQPNSQFRITLARPETFIFPREAFEKYGPELNRRAVGTGPFTLASVDEGKSVNLKRNPHYYRKDQYGNALPFLDGINMQFIKDKRTEFLEFKGGRLDMIYRVPTDDIMRILEESQANPDGNFGKYPLQREAESQTQIYAFQNANPLFKDVNVRKAISFAIDRTKILNYVLNGEGFAAGLHGLTPPAFDWYDIQKVKGYDFNRDSANYYLSKAGFPGGKGFPEITLDMSEEGGRHTSVAVEIKRQLKENLGIDLNLNVLPQAQITEKCLNGNYQMVRLAWVADFPSPENFLWMFHGKYVPAQAQGNSYPNVSRYRNPRFDALYEKALTASTQEEITRYFLEAEKVAMEDAPILVLWYDECYRLLQSHVKNLPNNPMQYRDFTEVYFANPAAETAKANLP
ncbi:MAG: ABC transporter substrate-binding protein [Bernardetiaceae bacterium]|jgi:peptide/nickel transport system substrate-binding protein|nr:ABC transporter substrate-binding protein [Bernardetiaceae bacterium]